MQKKSKNTLSSQVSYIIASLRIGLGWILLWAFMDKLWGLGFSTCRDSETGSVTQLCDAAWLSGGSPTTGFLKFGTSGPLGDNFSILAGQPWADWLFMSGLFLIGVALILGVGIRVAVATGVLLLGLMWLATLPPDHNPILSEHIIYILGLLLVGATNQQQSLGLGRWWQNKSLVRKFPILR